MLILYTTTSLNLLVLTIAGESLGFSYIRSCYLQTGTIWMHCIVFSCLTALARPSSTMLNISGKCGHSCLVQILEKKLSTFQLYGVICGFAINGLYCVDVCSLWSFNHEGVSVLSDTLSALVEMVTWLCFHSLMWCVMFMDRHMLSHLYVPGMNPIWSQPVIFSMYCWNCFGSIVLRIFASIFISQYGLYFSFLLLAHLVCY
jgi:hypothetical protein